MSPPNREQVREKKAERAARAAKERAAEEREERRAREGHAQLVAQAIAHNTGGNSGPFGDDHELWQTLGAEGSHEKLLGPAGV